MALACTFASLHLRIPSSKAGIRHAFSSRALQRTVCSQRPDLQKSLTSTTYRRHQNAQGHLTLRCMASGKHGQAKDEVATIALGCFWEPASQHRPVYGPFPVAAQVPLLLCSSRNSGSLVQACCRTGRFHSSLVCCQLV